MDREAQAGSIAEPETNLEDPLGGSAGSSGIQLRRDHTEVRGGEIGDGQAVLRAIENIEAVCTKFQ